MAFPARLLKLFRKTDSRQDHLKHLDPAAADSCEAALKYRFKNRSLLLEALTHRSYSRVNDIESNQRLEFLGDAVLELCTSRALFEKYPDRDEGTLTEARSAMVKGSNLTKVAEELDLGRFVLLGDNENQRGGHRNPSILADLYESLIGAVYLDGGYIAAERIIEFTIFPGIEIALEEGRKTNYKSRLLEFLQANALGEIEYVLSDSSGPDHDKTFNISAVLGKAVIGSGSGKRIKSAEQRAAKEAYEALTSDFGQ